MPSPGALICLASAVAFGAMGIFGKLAYDEGATVGTLLAVRFLLAAALFWVLVAATGAVRAPAHAPAPRRRRSRSRSAPSATAPRRAPTSPRSSGSTRRCCRCCSTRSRRWSRSPRSRSGASGRAAGRPCALALASAGLVLVLAGAGAGALDPLGALLGLAAAVIYTAYILTSAGDRRARRPARAERAGLHRRGGDAHAGRRRGRRPAPGRRERGGLRLAGGHRGRLDGRRGQPVLRRAASASARRPRRSSRRPSR